MTTDMIAIGLTSLVVTMVIYFFYKEVSTDYLSNTKESSTNSKAV